MLLGAAAVVVSLFLVWSHQLPATLRAAAPPPSIPATPTAWQVYSTADVVLALVAVAVAGVAIAGSRALRIATTVAVAVALAFVLHAHAVPPTDGVAFGPPLGPVHARPGPGETVATIGLLASLAGLALSFTA